MRFPKEQQAVPARDLQREGRPGDTILIPASEIDSGKSVVLGWRGPDMEPEEFAKKYLRFMKPEECGNLLVDMGGNWECFGAGYTVIGGVEGTMTQMEILKRLVDIARTDDPSTRTPRGILTADRLDQEQLFDVQRKLASLMADLANSIGPGAIARLRMMFPQVFE
jgi:hypothetical protein